VSIVSGSDFGLSICKALGIDPEYVRSIAIDARVGGLTVVVLRRFVTTDETNALVERFEREKYSVVKETA